MIGAIVLTHRNRKDTAPAGHQPADRRRPQDATRNISPEVGQGVEL